MKYLMHILFLGIILYLGVETWFVTALINSSTVNLDSTGIDYTIEGELVTAVGLTLNILFLLVKFLYKCDWEIQDFADEIYTGICFIALGVYILLALVSVGMGIFVSSVYFIGILFCIIAGMLVFTEDFQLFAGSLAIFIITLLVSFVLIHVLLSVYVAMASPKNVFCAVAGETANQLSFEHKVRLNHDWDSGNTFQSLENHQLERRFISIASCSNPDFLRLILSTNEFRRMFRDLAWKKSENKIKKAAAKHEIFKNNFSELYSGYMKMTKLKTRRTLKYAYKKFIKTLEKKGIKDAKALAEAISVSPKHPTMPLKRSQLFPVISDYYFGIGFTEKATEKDFIYHLFEKPFNEQYDSLINELDTSRIIEYKQDLRDKYKHIGRINLILTLSVIAVMCSLASIISTLVCMLPPLRDNFILRLPFSPLTFIACLWILSFAYMKDSTSPFYRQTLFPMNDEYSISEHALKIHITFFPTLKTFFNTIGVPAWLDTYDSDSKERNISLIKNKLDYAMRHKFYTTPVQDSALFQIERLYYLGEQKEHSKECMTKITKFYNQRKSKRTVERLAYINDKFDMFY